MGRASAAAKNRWNAKNYDRIGLMAPKGEGDEIKAAAAAAGMSVNAYILQAVREKMSRDGAANEKAEAPDESEAPA